jgi:hypothetical protein
MFSVRANKEQNCKSVAKDWSESLNSRENGQFLKIGATSWSASCFQAISRASSDSIAAGSPKKMKKADT